jgi:hypothetical protein
MAGGDRCVPAGHTIRGTRQQVDWAWVRTPVPDQVPGRRSRAAAPGARRACSFQRVALVKVLLWVSRRSRPVFHGPGVAHPGAVPAASASSPGRDNRLRRPRLRYCETGAWSVKAGERRTVAEFGLAAATRWLARRRPAWSGGTWAPFIASVELAISRIEAKVKMSQNRPPADIDGRDHRARRPWRSCRRGSSSSSEETWPAQLQGWIVIRGARGLRVRGPAEAAAGRSDSVVISSRRGFMSKAMWVVMNLLAGIYTARWIITFLGSPVHFRHSTSQRPAAIPSGSHGWRCFTSGTTGGGQPGR